MVHIVYAGRLWWAEIIWDVHEVCTKLGCGVHVVYAEMSWGVHVMSFGVHLVYANISCGVH